MTPKTIVKRRVVTKSISSDEGLRCEEYRKDPEANEGWFQIGFFEKVTEFASEDDAFDEACKLIPWLNKKCLA